MWSRLLPTFNLGCFHRTSLKFLFFIPLSTQVGCCVSDLSYKAACLFWLDTEPTVNMVQLKCKCFSKSSGWLDNYCERQGSVKAEVVIALCANISISELVEVCLLLSGPAGQFPGLEDSSHSLAACARLNFLTICSVHQYPNWLLTGFSTRPNLGLNSYLGAW